MRWEPISLEELAALMARDLAAAPEEERAYFARVAITPAKWRQFPWGDEGGGFWAVAIAADRVLWYNDIEDGFNVSAFTQRGEIPEDEYWCNQSSLGSALRRLRTGDGGRWGPPQPVDSQAEARPRSQEAELS